MTDEIRSYYLRISGREYWLSKEDGDKIRRLAELNPDRAIAGAFELRPLDSKLPVLIQFTQETPFILDASGDD